jgi:hypothetical protein
MQIGIKIKDPELEEFFEGFMGNRSKFIIDSLKYLIRTKKVYEVVMESRNGGFSEYYRENHPEDFDGGFLNVPAVADKAIPARKTVTVVNTSRSYDDLEL